VDVSPERFVEAYKTENPDVVAMSALLTTTMNEMKNTVEAFAAAGIRDNVVIMVGGAPLTENFCQSIGADIYAADAASAADAAKQAILNKKEA
jgi:5-methyltetrahydrofolate--homocysteine methyltransferase